MLMERIIFSTLRGSPNDAASESTIAVYDAHTYNHLTSFKRSNTAPNGLAVAGNHIFAAQADKAAVNVYGLRKGTLEMTVPFAEQFTVFTASNDGAYLAGGTENGRLTIWEIASGRFISTGPSHLQRVTAIAFTPDDNLILTASADSNIHVWSIAAFLSLSSSSPNSTPKPERILSAHQREITVLAIGRARPPASIAVSASTDLSAIVWDPTTGALLRRYLFTGAPLSLVIDPVDRGFYAGLPDGAIVAVDFHKTATAEQATADHPLFSEDRSAAAVPIPAERARVFISPGHDAAVTALATLMDGGNIVSGNAKGEVCLWDVASGAMYKKLFSPNTAGASTGSTYNTGSAKAPPPTPRVTSLHALPPTGFLPSPPPSSASDTEDEPILPPIDATFVVPTPMKPTYTSANHATPSTSLENYTVTAQFPTRLPTSASSNPAAFDPQADLELLLRGARDITLMGVGPSVNPVGVGVGSTGTGDVTGRVKELEDELKRMHSAYEKLSGLHRGLWERTAKKMMKEGSAVVDGAGRGRKRRATESADPTASAPAGGVTADNHSDDDDEDEDEDE